MINKVIGVSVGGDGAVWCADALGSLYMRVGSEWKRNPTAIANEVAVGNVNNVWCRNREGSIFKLQGPNYNSAWGKDPVASLVKQSISVGSDGTVWVVNTKGQLVKLEAGQWKHNPTGIAAEVSVGDANNVWCHNYAGELFQLQGSAWDATWVKAPSASNVVSIGAGNDGTVWVANRWGELWAKVGNEWRKNDKASAVVQVSAGNRDLVWCVNAAGEMFHAQSNDYATYWIKVPSPAMPKRVHVVKEGEWLLKIIRNEFNPTTDAQALALADKVAQLNGWPNREKVLEPGDVIILEA